MAFFHLVWPQQQRLKQSFHNRYAGWLHSSRAEVICGMGLGESVYFSIDSACLPYGYEYGYKYVFSVNSSVNFSMHHVNSWIIIR
ncbi:hypothetical protein M2105_004645 [Paenibacillus sp. PastF-1]|nr:hypothetical protein [Paenibacillus sp. PastF-2]MDF9850290.1 hypothetical protein [Paenibacillus sp. PastM-2]MDF9856770.1 hypothetical protein [Paenibacillus sp. PastF-1]MDH6482136.1 hypothetical protein [Paenibacillus sp. PastH-2]MDH6509557.1 hypothetical protein [Paenibacillus sp. PastM-3]